MSLFWSTEVRPYRYGLVVSIGQTDRQLVASARVLDRKFGADRAKEVEEAAIRWAGCPGYVHRWTADALLRIRNIPKAVSDHGVLIHELTHVVHGVLKARGMNTDSTTGEEAFAYLIEQLHNDICVRLDKHKARKTKNR